MIRVLDSAGSTLVEWGRQQQQHDFFGSTSNVNIDYLLDESRLELIKYDYHENYESDNNVDPDNSFNINFDCKYYTEYKFTQEINKVWDFFILHFNCRSLSANFKEIITCYYFIIYYILLFIILL